jgi:hypothetical protein
MLKTFRAGLLAFTALCLAPIAAHAACPTAPTYTGLSGLDAATVAKTLQTVTSSGSSQQLSTPLMHGNDGTTIPKALAVDANCNLDVNIMAGLADVSATAQSLASTLNAAYTLTLANGQAVTTFAVTGLTASAATLTIEASDDAGTTWAAVNGIAPATGALFTTLTADQQFRVNSAGRTRLRLRVSTAGSGTITVASNISTATSAVALSSPIPAGTNNIGTVQPGNTANTTPWLTTETPATAGGLTNYVLEPAASDNHANIKNGAGQVYGIHVFNNQATINYGRLYNAATGFNGCASATNLIYEFQIPGNTTGAGFVVAVPEGLAFGTGISICVTSTFGQTSVASATASAISLNVLYK